VDWAEVAVLPVLPVLPVKGVDESDFDFDFACNRTFA